MLSQHGAPTGGGPNDQALLEATAAHFGRDDAEIAGEHVLLEGLEFLYYPSLEPPFVLLPECEDCGTHAVDLFRLERWRLLDADVLGQATLTCRNCRISSSPVS